jgi:hypothetical protein
MTVNSKIDRVRLPRPGPANGERVAPVGEVEAAIAEVWSRLLDREAVGRTDDFFTLGGHSLLAARVSADLSGRLNIPIEACDVLAHPTVAELGDALAARQRLAEPVDTGAALLEHITALPTDAYAYLPGEPS